MMIITTITADFDSANEAKGLLCWTPSSINVNDFHMLARPHSWVSLLCSFEGEFTHPCNVIF